MCPGKASSRRCSRLWKGLLPLCRRRVGAGIRNAEFLQVDTTNILSSVAGLLLNLDKMIAGRNKGSAIGFGADVQAEDDMSTGQRLAEVEPEDLA